MHSIFYYKNYNKKKKLGREHVQWSRSKKVIEVQKLHFMIRFEFFFAFSRHKKNYIRNFLNFIEEDVRSTHTKEGL